MLMIITIGFEDFLVQPSMFPSCFFLLQVQPELGRRVFLIFLGNRKKGCWIFTSRYNPDVVSVSKESRHIVLVMLKNR